MRRKNEEVLALLDQATRELRTDKLDRAALSDLLTEMALRVTNDTAMSLDLRKEDLAGE